MGGMSRGGLIAVNYPARKFGVGRMTKIHEARRLCPELVSQHVATWREGDDKWAYHPDAFANMATHKVSLDPYRLESRKILALIKEYLPTDMQKVEKASIDEVFLDLSAQVHSILINRFSELRQLPSAGDYNQLLPHPSICALDWQADCLIDLKDAEMETRDPDWDDIALLIGSQIVRNIRAEIRKRLRYTCSAGIAKNKMLSKLGSAHNKPNQQTVIRSRAVQHFLSEFKFTKIRMLGGKLGDKISSTFGSDLVSSLLVISVDQLKAKLGDDTGIWVYNIIRGIDLSEVNPRTQIKSMLSAKAFRPAVTSSAQALKWLRIFAGDIFSRLVEEGVLENKRRPTSIALHHVQGLNTRSRQAPIPQGKPLNEDTLFEFGKGLLKQISAEGNVWPCVNLSLSVGGFHDGLVGNKGIGSYLVKRDTMKTLKDDTSTFTPHEASDLPVEKKRRLGTSGIERFFLLNQGSSLPNPSGKRKAINDKANQPESTSIGAITAYENLNEDGIMIKEYHCSKCFTKLMEPQGLQSHQDWHIAKELQEAERVRPVLMSRPEPLQKAGPVHRRVGVFKRSRGKKLEQGQSRLKFN